MFKQISVSIVFTNQTKFKLSVLRLQCGCEISFIPLKHLTSRIEYHRMKIISIIVASVYTPQILVVV